MGPCEFLKQSSQTICTLPSAGRNHGADHLLMTLGYHMKMIDDRDTLIQFSEQDFLGDSELDALEMQESKRDPHDRPDRPDRLGFRVACVRNDIWECCFTLSQARQLVKSHKDSTGHEVGILGGCTIPAP